MNYVLVSVGTLAVSGLVVLGVLGATALLGARAELTLAVPNRRGALGPDRVPPGPAWSLPTLQAPPATPLWQTPTRYDTPTDTPAHGQHSVARRPGATPGLPGRFGPYHLHQLLGQGAMGQVWRAFDTRRHRWVALKLLPDDPDLPARARHRMQHEAQLAGRLSSAHVVPVHDFGRLDGINFLDMRLVPGGDLATLLRAHPQGLDPHRVARIATQIADALDATHHAGLTHCDVKPSNVLLDTTATGDFCYLADFGIATLTNPSLTTPKPDTITTPPARPACPTICGTPTYMAPEMFTGIDAASPASDVYALGVLIHELLTGRPPFPGPDLPALHRQHTDQHPPPLSGPDPTLTAALDTVLSRALDKNPHRRPPSAGALATALTTALAPTTAPTTAGHAAHDEADRLHEVHEQPTPTSAGPGPGPDELTATPGAFRARSLRELTSPGDLPSEALGNRTNGRLDDSLDAVFLTTDPPREEPTRRARHPAPQAA